MLFSTCTHTTGRPRVPVWPEDEGVELVTPPWGVRPREVAVSQSWSTPACLAWLELRLPTHSHSWHITHSTHCTAQRFPAALHELILWCSIKTTTEQISHWYDPGKWRLHERLKNILMCSFKMCHRKCLLLWLIFKNEQKDQNEIEKFT